MSIRTAFALAAWLACGAALPVWAADQPTPAGNALLTQGDKLWADGKVDEARKSFEQAVNAMPRAPKPRMKLAGLLLANRQYADAVRAYQDTISLDAGNANAWIGLGLAYRHAGDRELSRAAFEEALRLDPSRKEKLAQLMAKSPEQPQ